MRAWLLWWRSLGRRGRDHQLEALLGSGQLRDVVLGMRSTDVLLHGAISLFLADAGNVTTYVLAKAMGEPQRAASAETGVGMGRARAERVAE